MRSDELDRKNGQQNNNPKYTRNRASLFGNTKHSETARSPSGQYLYHENLVAAIVKACPFDIIKILNPKLRYSDNTENTLLILRPEDTKLLNPNLLTKPILLAMQVCAPNNINFYDRFDVLTTLGKQFLQLRKEMQRLEFPEPNLEEIAEFGDQYPIALDTFRMGLKEGSPEDNDLLQNIIDEKSKHKSEHYVKNDPPLVPPLSQ